MDQAFPTCDKFTYICNHYHTVRKGMEKITKLGRDYRTCQIFTNISIYGSSTKNAALVEILRHHMNTFSMSLEDVRNVTLQKYPCM